MALSILWVDNGNARAGPAVPSMTDTMVIPANSNTVLFLLLGKLHTAVSTAVTVTLTGETVDTIDAFNNSTTDSTLVEFGAFAVRDPTAGTKTLTVNDDGLLRSMAWHGWLVSGVPASGYTDAINHVFGNTTSSTTETLNLTSTKPNGLLLGFFGWRGSTAGPFSVTAGWTEDADVNAGASPTTDVSYEAVSRTAPTAGAYSATCTSTTSVRHGVIAVSVLASSARRRQQVIII